EDGGADGPARYAQGILREVEDVIPKARLEVAFELGEVEVRPASFSQQALRVVEEVEAEGEQAARNRLPAHLDVTFVEVPSARADDQRRHLVVEAVFLALRARERKRPLDGIDQVDLALDEVRPRRRVGVLELGHETRPP